MEIRCYGAFVLHAIDATLAGSSPLREVDFHTGRDGGRFANLNSPIFSGSLHVRSWQRARPSTATSTKNLFSPTLPAHFPPRLPSWRCRAKNASGFVGSFFGRSSGSKLAFGGGGSLAGGWAAAAVDWMWAQSDALVVAFANNANLGYPAWWLESPDVGYVDGPSARRGWDG